MHALVKKLNEIYAPVIRRAQSISAALSARGFAHKTEFHNGHFIKDGADFVEELFPIPVIGVEGLCDVEIQPDCVEVTSKLSREQAMKFDYTTLRGDFEIYGVENYLDDFYNKDMSTDGIADRIARSDESEIFFGFSFADDADAEAIAEFAEFIEKLGFFY